MSYVLPTNTDWVTCSFNCHRDRTPPSGSPGTDYGSGYGSPLYAVGTGRIADLSHSTAGGTGRYVTIDLDDGRRTRSLHLSEIWVNVGDRVTQGQQIGKTGASGFGSDWGYGAHVHQSLFPTHAYNWADMIDFQNYVGAPTPGPTQRVTGPNGANQRPEPTTTSPVANFIAANVLADFNGWIRGEAVNDNNVWFRGAHSGLWSHSGAFTDSGTHDLADLNPVTPPSGNSRVTGPNGANGRSQPDTTVPVINALTPGQIGVFSGWINGENVQGNAVWFFGTNDTWYWSGGFTDQGTHDLTDLNPVPVPGAERTVAVNPANVRDYPFTSVPAVASEDGGTVVKMKAWAYGDTVQDIDVWFQRDQDSKWMWSGGFTSQSTTGLVEVDAPEPPPSNNDNPRGLPEYEPVWPLAFLALAAPLGFTDCQNPVTRTPRDKAGSDQHPVDPIIDTYIIHWTDTGTDDLAATNWHSYCNSRSSCPTTQINRDGRQTEFIRPGAKPAATGPDWNWRSFAVETVGGPDNFTPEQWEMHAQNIALLAEHDGGMLDGVPVSFAITREHVLGHRDATPGTECPGDAQMAGLDALLARAQAIYDEHNPPDPDCPDCPECPDPTEPVDYDRIAQVVNDEAARRLSA